MGDGAELARKVERASDATDLVRLVGHHERDADPLGPARAVRPIR